MKKKKKKNEINGEKERRDGTDGKEDRFDSLVCVSFDPDALGRHKVVFLGGPGDVVGGRHRHASHRIAVPFAPPIERRERERERVNRPEGSHRLVLLLLLDSDRTGHSRRGSVSVHCDSC